MAWNKTAPITADIADNTSQGSSTGTFVFSLADLSENAIIRRAPGNSLDEGVTFRVDRRVLPSGKIQYRRQVVRGITDGMGETRSVDAVVVNLTVTAPSFASLTALEEAVKLMTMSLDRATGGGFDGANYATLADEFISGTVQ